MFVITTMLRDLVSILSVVWQWPKRCIVAVSLLCIVVFSSLTVLRKLEAFVDITLKTTSNSAFTQAMLEILALISIYATSTSVREYIVRRLTDDTTAELYRKAYTSTLYRSLEYFETNSPGSLVGRITADTDEVGRFVDFIFSIFVKNALLLVSGCILMYQVNAELFYYSAIIVPGVVFILFAVGGRIGPKSHRVQAAKAELASEVTESLNAIENIKVFCNEPYREKRIGYAINQVIFSRRALNLVESVMTGLLIMLCLGSITSVVWLGVLRVTEGTLSAGALVSFLGILMMVAVAAASLGDTYAVLSRASVAYRRLLELIQGNLEYNRFEHDSSRISNSQTQSVNLGEDPLVIEFKDVTFSYPSRSQTIIIEPMNLEIKQSNFVAFVGRSGVGKSTLIKLMLQLYPITSGEIRLCGRSLTEMSMVQARSIFSVVTQSPHLFNGTLLENIIMGDNQVSEAYFNEILKLSAVDCIVEKLKDGLQTPVGEQGVCLSGGERQRIAFARALVRDSQVIILDEATSHLDANTEKVIQKSISSLSRKKTIIVIAHRLSSVKRADVIYVIDKGRVVEQGTHLSLLSKQGLYASLAENQFIHNEESS